MPTITGLFAGGRAPLGDEGQMSGIRKRAVPGRIFVSSLGLDGDEQVDRRYHGGLDRAVHFFATESYDALRVLYPASSSEFQPGSIGENISCRGLTDRDACIGDIYSIGGTLLQVTQPRSPCWKINARFDIDDLSRAVQNARLTGWFARVLKEGEIEPGAEIALQHRNESACSIAQFWDIFLADPPNPEDLARAARLHGLAALWRDRLASRVAWIAQRSK